MKTAILFLAMTLMACSGFNKVLEAPWPGDQSAQLLYWCVPENDGIWGVYVDVPPLDECPSERVSRGQWDLPKLPLTVVAGKGLHEETNGAVLYINAQLGFDVFRMLDGEGACHDQDTCATDIAVFAYGEHYSAAAEAVMYTDGGRRYGAVLAYNGLGELNRSDIIVHELGHLLGLAHDHGNIFSVMYPSESYTITKLEPRDIKLLQELYGSTVEKAP